MKQPVDKKVVILKSDIPEDLMQKIYFGKVVYGDIENLAIEKEITSEDKKSGKYIIIQHSFILTQSKEEMLFLSNRSPRGFDEDARLTKGITLFFSVSKNTLKDKIEESIQKKIKNSMMFYDYNKKIINDVTCTISAKGCGYREYKAELEIEKNNSFYLFFIYDVAIEAKNINDIIFLKKKENIIDMDYIFPINKDFLVNSYSSFLNSNAHLDICYLKSIETQDKSAYKHAKYFPYFDKLEKIYKIDYTKKDKTNFTKLIKTYVKNNYDGVIADAMLAIDDSEFSAIAEIAKCFFKVPLGFVKLQNRFPILG